MRRKTVKNIALFASGTGSNAKKIITYFANNKRVNVALIISNKSTAKVLDIAAMHRIPTLIVNRKDFYETEMLLADLARFEIDFIALAGFLWLVPPYLVEAFPKRMINIHPALLPKYGGKGMYGMNVHKAVRANKETESGITLHYVNERYDEGNIIFQASCKVSPGDKAENIRNNVLKLEHYFFPRILESLLTD